MEQTNNNEVKKVSDETRKTIQKKVIILERYNYNQKEFTTPEMLKKIKTIIEKEVNNDDNQIHTN
ncbi:MAG: hypothetical protein ACLSUV_01680 [Bacilli bacterium]